MSLKEWKNNELNKQLLKKFGILKEEKKSLRCVPLRLLTSLVE